MSDFFKYGEERFSRYTSPKKNIIFSVIKFLFPYYRYQKIKQNSEVFGNLLVTAFIYFGILTPIGFAMQIYNWFSKKSTANSYWEDANKND